MDSSILKVDAGFREIGYSLLATGIVSLIFFNVFRKTPSSHSGQRTSTFSLPHHLILGSIALMAMAVAAATGMFAPTKAVEYVFREGGGYESATAGVFLTAFLAGIGFLVIGVGDRLVVAGISLLGLMGYLDEVSYGMRLFEFRPSHWGVVQIDGFHDMIEAAFYALRAKTDALLTSAAVGGVVLTGIVAWSALRGTRVREFGQYLIQCPATWFGPWAIGFALVSCVIDFGVWQLSLAGISELGSYIEEALELSAAAALLFALHSVRPPIGAACPPEGVQMPSLGRDSIAMASRRAA